MSTSNIVKSARPLLKDVKAVLSNNRDEARRRVLNLYKLWYRQAPYIVLDYDVPLTVNKCRDGIRKEFEKNKNVNDIRVIDLLVVKGQMELVETAEIWKQRSHIMSLFEDNSTNAKKLNKSNDFLTKFYN